VIINALADGRYVEEQSVGLFFDFHNGAMSTDQPHSRQFLRPITGKRLCTFVESYGTLMSLARTSVEPIARCASGMSCSQAKLSFARSA
jgi:hypothetical protein